MQNISHQKWIFILFIILITLGSIGAVTYAQVTGGDGYILEDENTIRAVDFRTATGTVPAGVEFETEVIVANYGTSEENIDLEAQVYNVDNTGNIGGVVEDEVVDINPVERYNTNIKPGEHRRYNYLLRFDRNEANAGERYAVRITDTPPVSPDNLPPSQKFINISDNDSSTFDGSQFINRNKADVEFIDMKRFKDKNSKDSTIPASTTDIPPVETDENNQITDSVTAGKGIVKSFQDIASNEDISGSIQPGSTNSMNIGFSTDIDDRSKHYGIRVSYTTGSTLNMDKIELKLVDSLGQEVDENTTYKLSSVSGNVPESQIIHLSSKEVKYIQNQKSINLVFNSTDAGSGKIDLYELRVVSSNDIFSLPEPDLNAFDMSVSPTGNAEVGEIVKISGKIKNTGSAVSYRSFRLYEENILKDSVKISDRRVINPGDTIDLTYSYQIQESGEHQFRLLDQTVDLTVEGDEIFGINPTISKSPVKAATGQDVEFIMNVDTDEESKVDSNVKEVRWYLNDQSTVDETISDPSSSSETLIERSFSTEGKKQVFMEYDYEADGRQETISRSTTIDIIGGPNPDVSAYYSDFGTISSGTSLSSINSASGVISATSCEIECGGNFVLFSDYPTTNGISMLVVDRDNEEASHKEVFYGTYEVGKSDGNYSTTDTFNSDSLDDVREDLDTGTSGRPSEALKNDIQRYRDGGDEDRIFIFTSAGNPKPAEYESEIYNQLSDLGADLDGGHTDSLTLQENSIWFFASQQTDSGGIPLFERYVPPNVDNPSLSEEVQLRDIEVSESGTVPLGRKLYMSAKDTELAGTIDDATITWEDRGDGTQDTGLMTGVTYSSQGTKQVKLTVEDIVGNEVTGTFEYNVGFRNPTANIVSSDLIIGQRNFIDSTGSFDNDGAIDSYVWDINDGEATLRGQNPSYSWSKIGENKVQLTVKDRNGNTDTTTENVEVSPEEPEPVVNINRLPASYDLRPNTPYYIKEEPVTHHPLNQISNEFSPDIWGGYSGNIGSGVQQVGGVTNGAADLSGTSDAVSIPHTDDFNTDNMTISIWVKPSSVSGESSVVSKEGVFDLRVSDGRLRFDVAGSASYQVSNSQIPTDVWSHIAVSYDTSGDIGLHIDGNLVERFSTGDSLSSSTSPVLIGNNQRGQPYDGFLDSFRMYDKALDSTDISLIDSNDASIESDRIQNVFYEFGENRYDLQISEGDVNERSNSIYLSTDSTSGNNDTASVRTQSIDIGNYESIKITYEFDAQRQETLGNPTTGQVKVEADGRVERTKINGFRSDSRSGIMSLDASTLSGESEIKISAETFGSNRGTSSLRIFEIWGESLGERNANRGPEEYFSSGVYPSVSSDTKHLPSRSGYLSLSNALPKGNIAEIDIENQNNRRLQNHQVKIQIRHQSGMSSDFGDIKFFDTNSIELDHWVEDYDAGSSATVWLEVSDIRANSIKTVNMLYDSSYSDTSNPEDTFEHFDDFNTDSSSDWTLNRISNSGIGDRFIWDSSQSRLKTDETGSQWYSTYSNTKFDNSLDKNGFVAETRVQNDGSNAVGVALETDSNTDYNPYVSVASSGYEGRLAALDESLIGITGDGGLGLSNYGSIVGSDSSIQNYHTVGLIYDGDSTLSSSYDRNIQSTTYTGSAIDVGEIGLASLRNIQPAYYDWFIVRKYAESQPEVVDKRYFDREDTSSSLAVSDLSSSDGDVRIRYETQIYNSTTSGTNLFSSDTYAIDGTVGSVDTIYCSGIQVQPSCSDSGDSRGNLDVTESGALGVASELSSQGIQTMENMKVISQESEAYPHVLLNATQSTASGDGNRIVKYEWDTNGGSFDVDKVGEEIQLSLSDGVSREIELRVTDETGAQERTTINIPVSNAEPRNMDLSAPSTAEVGEEIFISSTFDDDNKKKVTYIFETGDRIVAGPEESIVKQFSTDGRVKVTAVAVDEYGQTTSATTTIDIQSDPPDLSGLEDSITTNVRDTIVLDGTGNVTSVEDIEPDITTIYDASNVPGTSGDTLDYRYVLPNGEVKQGNTVKYVPQMKTGSEEGTEIVIYVTNSVGQTSKKNITLYTTNEGPRIDEFIINKNYDKESEVLVESSTCDSQGYCGSKIEYNGFDVSGGLANDDNKGINMLVINRDNQPQYFGAYNTDDGDSYSTANEFDAKGRPTNLNTEICDDSGCATTKLTNDIDNFKNESGVRLVLVGEGQPMPNSGQGGSEVTIEEGELYNEITSLGGTLNSSGSTGPGLVTDSYEVDFQGGTQGWKSDKSTLTQKSGDWAAPLCSPSKTSRIENTDLIDVGQNSIENTIKYSARLAAIDGWDNEDLVLELRYDGSWREVERKDPINPTTPLAVQGAVYDNPSDDGLACPEFTDSFASEDGPVDVIEFEGELTVSGRVTGARVIMDDSNDGSVDKDYLESFAIDYLRLNQKDYVGIGLEKNDMWMLHTENDRDGEIVDTQEFWEPRGDISGKSKITETISMSRNRTVDRDKLNISVESYVPHPRIGGNLTVQAQDGSTYRDTILSSETEGHNLTFNHTVNLGGTSLDTLPANYTINATAIDDFNDSINRSTGIAVGASKPNAEIEADKYNVLQGEVVNFDGSTSTDPQNSELTYQWDLNDSKTATGPTASNSYTGIDNKTVNLTVTNEFGQSNTESVEIAVVDKPSVNLEIREEDSQTSTAKLDADATAYGDNNSIEKYRFYPGDETGPIETSDPEYIRNYSKGGIITAEVEVVDKYGQVGSATDSRLVGVPISCSVIYNYISQSSGTYTIDPDKDGDNFDVYCDMDFRGGGWTAIDPPTAQEFIRDVGGGIEIPTGSTIQKGYTSSGFDGNQQVYPYTLDGNGNHGMKYIIQAGFEFDEIHLSEITLGSTSYLGGGATSEVRDQNTLRGDWRGFNSGGVSGDIGFGTRTQVVNSWSNESGSMIKNTDNYVGGPGSSAPGSKIIFPDNGYIYDTSKTSTAAIGWGESGGQDEGWTWKGGEMYIR